MMFDAVFSLNVQVGVCVCVCDGSVIFSLLYLQ